MIGCKNNSDKIDATTNLNDDKEDLRETGRLQIFLHSPCSELPIRDILKENKREPHIEIGAENYWNCCYQPGIRSFCKNSEKYLFLLTKCQNEDLQRYYKKNFIVGYIIKRATGIRNGKYFVKGDTFLFSFEDAYPMGEGNLRHIKRKKSVDETKKILAHFEGRKNILKECINEIKRLDEDNKTCLRKAENRECDYFEECLRWNNENSTESKRF